MSRLRPALRLPALLVLVAIALAVGRGPARAQVGIFHVAAGGSDVTGDGSAERPWATIDHAARSVPITGSVVLVGDGQYGTVRIDRDFPLETVFRSASSYGARLVAGDRSALDLGGSTNVTVVGFEITAGPATTAGVPLVYASGARVVRLRDIVFHDGPGPLLRLEGGARDVLVVGCLFHGAGPARGQVELAGVEDVRLRSSILVADARRSQGAGSFVSVRAGPGGASRDVAVERNIFLRWARAGGRGFVAIGAVGDAGPTADGVLIENNLMLGGSAAPMGAPLSVVGARGVSVRANTVVGALRASAFALADLGEPGAAAASDLSFHNNIWSDSTGAMAPLSVGPPDGATGATARNNLYWNGGAPVPEGSGPLRAADDPAAVVGDPGLPDPRGAGAPLWDGPSALIGGHASVDAAFRALTTFARTAPESLAIDRADPDHMPSLDLSGRPRGMPDIGALEHRPVLPGSPTPVTQGTPTPGELRRHLPAVLRRARPAGSALVTDPHRLGASP